MADYFWTTLFALIALFWVVQGTRAVRGMAKLPTLDDVPLLEDGRYPRVSILVAHEPSEEWPSYPPWNVPLLEDGRTHAPKLRETKLPNSPLRSLVY